eukprot:SAG11_NODE_1074_length_5968_cov_2.041063_9_plen_170_part_00
MIDSFVLCCFRHRRRRRRRRRRRLSAIAPELTLSRHLHLCLAGLYRGSQHRVRARHKAATTLQALCRMPPLRRALVARRESERARRRLLLENAAAATIQSGWRGLKLRWWVASCHHAATRLQARWRTHAHWHHRPHDLRMGAVSVARACHNLLESRPFAQPGQVQHTAE